MTNSNVPRRKRTNCLICGASPVSSRNCDSAVFGARNPTPVQFQSNEETGQSEEEKLMERLREKGWDL